jgi:hypothetical protein
MIRPTIYEELKTKLGRRPTDAELVADVKRILHEGFLEMAAQRKLKAQRRGR